MVETDNKALELIAQIKAKKEGIAKAKKKPEYRTNCHFFYNGDLINIQATSDVVKLINIVGFLIQKKNSYLEAVKFLNLDNPPDFIWQNHSAEDWINDLEIKIKKIQVIAEEKKLESLEERLNRIVSPEKRAELELEAIENELK